MTRLIAFLAALALPVAAVAQTVTITSPNTVNPSGQPKSVTDVFVRNADGSIATLAGGGGTSFPADTANTGTIPAATLNAAYTITTSAGQNTSAFIVSGLTASGATLTLEGSNDGGTTWTNVYSPNGATGITTNTFTADGGFSANVAARTRLRLRVSTAGTGTITVTSNTSVAIREVRLDTPLPPGANTIGGVNLLTGGAALATGAGAATAQTTRVTLASDSPLSTGAATSALQTSGNTSLAALSGTVNAVGATAPANAQQVGGIDTAGFTRPVRTDSRGGLAPAQGIVASTRTTLTASTSTAIEAAAVPARIGISVFAEATLTAPVFLCTTQTTACSATSYDFLIPSGAGAGTVYSFIFATTGRTYAYSTAAQVVVLNSWTAP